LKSSGDKKTNRQIERHPILFKVGVTYFTHGDCNVILFQKKLAEVGPTWSNYNSFLSIYLLKDSSSTRITFELNCSVNVDKILAGFVACIMFHVLIKNVQMFVK